MNKFKEGFHRFIKKDTNRFLVVIILTTVTFGLFGMVYFGYDFFIRSRKKTPKNKSNSSSNGFFAKSFKGIKGRFRGFSTLIAMQLKEQLNFSFKANKKQAITKLILLTIGFAAITAAIYLIMYLLGFLGILGGNGVLPVPIFNVFLYLILILNTISCIHRMTNSLYFSKDNQVLLTYPVNSGVIFLSKMVVFYVLELIKNFMMLIPLFLAYAISNSFAFYFYPWLILIFAIVTMIPVALGGVISIPYMYVLTFVKKSQYIQSILVILSMIAGTVLIFFGISKIPSSLNIAKDWSQIYYPSITQFTYRIEDYSGPLKYISALFLGYRGYIYTPSPRSLGIINVRSFIILAIVIAIVILSSVLSYLLARPLFFKMATKPFEYRKKIIDHNYKMNFKKEKLYERAFRPELVYPISKKDKKGIVNKLSKLLRIVNKEEKLFLKRKINTKRILRFLNKYAKKLKFEEVDINEIVDFGYVIQTRNGVPFLVLIKDIKNNIASCYDPYYLKKKNHSTNSILSIFIKEILLDIRTPGIIVSNFMLFIITPIAIALLNAIFRAINASFQGQTFTVMFNVLIILLITLASNVSIASIYSREGNTSYMLKAAPINYMSSLGSKLVIRAIIVSASILATSIIYSKYSTISYLRADLLFLTFLFIYLGHLIWSAELDFMNPQDRLYAEVGVNVMNPNETTSAVLVFIISLVFMGITFFFVNKEVSKSFVKIMLIAFAFLAVRVLLFVLKVVGYGTSRTERRNG